MAGVPQSWQRRWCSCCSRFNLPGGVAVDGAGHIYVADSGNSTIRSVTPAGVVTTLAGSAWRAGSVDGIGPVSRFYCPSGVAVDSVGNIFVADVNNETVRKVTPTGMVTTLAGSAGQVGSATARARRPVYSAAAVAVTFPAMLCSRPAKSHDSQGDSGGRGDDAGG